MTTYNTYQEAKIDNPECEIYTNGNEFVSGDELTSDVIRIVYLSVLDFYKCNPIDHCMTVEKFLADGCKFVYGDVLLDAFGELAVVGNDYTIDGANLKLNTDDRRYILRAAALEEKKPRTKVEYVKCEFEFLWEAVKAFEDGEEFYTHFTSDGWVAVKHAQQVIPNLQVDKLYRCIETPMTEREAFVDECKKFGGLRARDGADEVYGNLYDSGKFKLVN